MRPSLLLCAGLFFLFACSETPPPPAKAIQPIKVITVQSSSGQTRELPGVVRASQRVDLAFQVPGRLEVFDLKEGQAVKQGDLLAQLDDSDYRSSVSAARADRDQSRANFARAEEMIKKDFISKMDYDRLKAAAEISQSNLDKAEKALRDTQMVAPFSGVVARKYVDNFTEVQAKQPIISLQDKDNLEVVVNISENLLARAAGMEDRTSLDISASFDALPGRKFELFIKEYTTEADATTQTFQYVLGIRDRQGVNLLPGMTAQVSAINKQALADQVSVIPLQALTANSAGEKIVWRLDANSQVQPVRVATGQILGTQDIQILEGLNQGDVVAIAGLSTLSEGLTVKPITEVRY